MKIASGERGFWEAAESAAMAWRFGTGEPRKVRLEFQFKLMPHGTSNIDLSPRFKPPFTIEVRGIVAQVDAYTIRDVGEGKR